MSGEYAHKVTESFVLSCLDSRQAQSRIFASRSEKARPMNKYKRWHDAIIARAHSRDLDAYKERHHIVPRCLDGSDHPSNLVDLTYREHFLVHWLLTKLHVGRDKVRMVYAVHAMTLGLGPRNVGSWRIAHLSPERKYWFSQFARPRKRALTRIGELAVSRVRSTCQVEK